jgi:hypothetical protein
MTNAKVIVGGSVQDAVRTTAGTIKADIRLLFIASSI